MTKKLKTIQVKTRVDQTLYNQFQEAVAIFGEGSSAALRQAIRDFIVKTAKKSD